MSYCKRCYLDKINPEAKQENFIYFDEPDKCECCGKTRLLIDKYENDEDYMSVAECNEHTRDHIDLVQYYIKKITDELTQRGIDHDKSKLSSPEVEHFARETRKLARLKYVEKDEISEEYKESLARLNEALVHHYATNRHHPEHFANGIEDMDLVDVLEMFCDWKAATKRQNGGNLLLSIQANGKKFNIDPQLLKILENTAKYIDRD